MAYVERGSQPDYSELEVVPGAQAHSTEVAQGLEVDYAEHDPKGFPIARPIEDDGKIVSEKNIPSTAHHKSLPPPPPPATVCGIRRKTFWILAGVGATVIAAAAIGGGVGGSLAHRSKSQPTASGQGNQTIPSNTTSRYQNLGIAALHWIEGANTSQYRVYYPQTNLAVVSESAWSSDTKSWTVSTITDEGADIKTNSPIACSAGYPHTNTSNALAKSVYFLQRTGAVTERQSPYKDQPSVWGNDNFSGLYTASDLSRLFSYWYQNFDTKVQIITMLFQELGANSLTVARYFQNSTDDQPWQSTKQSISIQDGSSIAAAPVGSRRDLRLYLGGTDGSLTQYPYNIETNALGTPTSLAFKLAPQTPLCVTTEDNRNYFTANTLPQCARTNTGAFFTHLILFATPDRHNLTLVSWNCSSGFSDQSSRIAKLLKPDRTYLGLASADSTRNLTFVDNRVYILYDEGKGPAVEEWQIPTSGGSNTTGQNGEWKLLGEVPVTSS